MKNKISEGLSKLLADTSVLYLKTHNFHWNVTGPMFPTLHLLFETQYNELWMATDLIAERIRALGFPAPGSYSQYKELASVKEETSVPRSKEMIRQLLEGHETVTKTAKVLLLTAEEASDDVTVDLLTQRIQIHEKTAWMLRSTLEE